MAELRRLHVSFNRLDSLNLYPQHLPLLSDEIHYVKRVLRLKVGDKIVVVDGVGHLWETILQNDNSLLLTSDVKKPLITKPITKPLLGIAVVVPRRGFKEVIRMSCELGIDLIQPLKSSRSNPAVEIKPDRWHVIMNEAVEQSERLWSPKLSSIISASDWFNSTFNDSIYCIAQTRDESLVELVDWLETKMKPNVSQAWVTIGPEGGWTNEEMTLAIKRGFTTVKLGETILTTSTAAIASAHTVVSYRSSLKSINQQLNC